jgi:hypothetical protein
LLSGAVLGAEVLGFAAALAVVEVEEDGLDEPPPHAVKDRGSTTPRQAIAARRRSRP